MKKLNLEYVAAGEIRKLQLLELEEFIMVYYENANISKEKKERNCMMLPSNERILILGSKYFCTIHV